MDMKEYWFADKVETVYKCRNCGYEYVEVVWRK